MSWEALKIGECEILPVLEAGWIILEWHGTISSSSPEDQLDPYFEQVIIEAKQEGMSVRCDFSELEHMSSATIAPLIQFLRKLAENEITAEFVYDASRKVHAASFRALEVIASKSKYTKVKGLVDE